MGGLVTPQKIQNTKTTSNSLPIHGQATDGQAGIVHGFYRNHTLT